MRIAMSLLICLALVSSTAGQEKPKVETDIVYGKAENIELKLDLCRPVNGKGPYPVVACFHGGGWRMGNKRELRSMLEFLADRGFVAVSVGYRLAPDHIFPSQIEDSKTAIRFLRSNSEKYSINKEKIGVVGYSAGGHLVSLLGLTDAKAGFEGKLYPEESSRVQCVIDYFGPVDLPAFGKDDTAQRSMIGPFLGGKYAEKPQIHEKASPINYVSKDAPPFLIFHGDKDWIVPIDQSRRFHEKLKDAGVSSKLVEIPGESHGWGGKPLQLSTRETLQFLNEHLKK